MASNPLASNPKPVSPSTPVSDCEHLIFGYQYLNSVLGFRRFGWERKADYPAIEVSAWPRKVFVDLWGESHRSAWMPLPESCALRVLLNPADAFLYLADLLPMAEAEAEGTGENSRSASIGLADAIFALYKIATWASPTRRLTRLASAILDSLGERNVQGLAYGMINEIDGFERERARQKAFLDGSLRETRRIPRIPNRGTRVYSPPLGWMQLSC